MIVGDHEFHTEQAAPLQSCLEVHQIDRLSGSAISGTSA